MARNRLLSVWLKTLLLVFAVVFVGLGATRKLWVRSALWNAARYRVDSTVAERLAGTPLQGAGWVQRRLSFFGGMERYRAANRLLPPAAPERVVFYGDSITDYWVTRAPETFFPGRPYIGRGVTGQATPELLWRFRQDALDLHPQTVVLLGGTNDIVLQGLHIGDAETRDNLRRMVTMAQQSGVRVVLCSVLPVSYARPARQRLFTARIEALNGWMRSFAAANHLAYVDYFSALADAQGSLPASLSTDGLHPNAAGYRMMQGLVDRTLEERPQGQRGIY